MMGGMRIEKQIEIVDGVEHLRCKSGESGERCLGLAPLAEFPAWADGKPRSICRACLNARKKRYLEEGRLTPKSQESKREAHRRWIARNPEHKKQLDKEARQRVKDDPVRHARFLETRRMEGRLRAEREGRTPRASRHGKRVAERGPKRVTSEPLVALIGKIVDRRAAVAGLIDNNDDVGVEAVCADLGVNSRTYRRWRDEGTSVNIGTAEAVLLAAGVEWHEVYSYDDHAEAFLAIEVEA